MPPIQSKSKQLVRPNGSGQLRRSPEPLKPTDSELLMRFVRHRDQAAFEELVTKHAAMVWNVCWQILRRHHDVEDSFQATFLILARRASSIRTNESLAGWLYRVAYRTSLRSRFRTRSTATEALQDDPCSEEVNCLERIQDDEHRGVLLEELQALPARYQEPLVLCYLAGNSRGKVANDLSLTLGTVKGRLARGKQLLRQRLIRRGVSLSLAMAAVQAAAESAHASFLPHSALAKALVCRTGSWLTSHPHVTPQSLHLAEQGIRTMQIISATKLAAASAVLIASATLGLAALAGESDRPMVTGSGATFELAADQRETTPQQHLEIKEAQIHVAAPGEGRTTEKVFVSPPATLSAAAVTIEAPTSSTEHTVQIAAPTVPQVPPPANMTQPLPPDDAVQVKEIPLEMVEVKVDLAKKQAEITDLLIESKKAEIAALESSVREREELMREAQHLKMRAELATLEAQRLREQAEVEHLETQKKTLPQQQVMLQMQLQALQTALAEVRASEQKLRAELDAVREQIQHEAKSPRENFTAPTPPAARQPSLPDVSQAFPEPNRYVAAPQPYNPAYPPGFAVKPGPVEDQRSELRPGDVLHIEVLGTLPGAPIDDIFRIEPMGTVALGAAYGRVELADLDLLSAEEVLTEHLSKTLQDPKVQITRQTATIILGERVQPQPQP